MDAPVCLALLQLKRTQHHSPLSEFANFDETIGKETVSTRWRTDLMCAISAEIGQLP